MDMHAHPKRPYSHLVLEENWNRSECSDRCRYSLRNQSLRALSTDRPPCTGHLSSAISCCGGTTAYHRPSSGSLVLEGFLRIACWLCATRIQLCVLCLLWEFPSNCRQRCRLF